MNDSSNYQIQSDQPSPAQGLYQPEWLRIPDATKVFGLSRSKLYELIAERKIKSFCLRQRNKIKGIRLLSYDSLSDFTSTSVTGAGAVLTFDVQINGVWSDSGTPPVAIVGSISGQLQGIVNAQMISAVRVRSSSITGGSCAVNSALIPIH